MKNRLINVPYIALLFILSCAVSGGVQYGSGALGCFHKHVHAACGDVQQDAVFFSSAVSCQSQCLLDKSGLDVPCDFPHSQARLSFRLMSHPEAAYTGCVRSFCISRAPPLS